MHVYQLQGSIRKTVSMIRLPFALCQRFSRGARKGTLEAETEARRKVESVV